MPMMQGEPREPSQFDMFPETTRRILLELKRRGEASVPELAESLDLSSTAVRQPLQTLVAGGFVGYDSVGHGRGRRRHAYSLKPKAEQIFPRPYYRLATNLLEFLRERSPELLSEFLRTYGRAYADDLYERASERPPDEALQRAAEWYEDLGYLTGTEVADDGQLELTMYHCPYLELAHSDSLVCEREVAALERVFSGYRTERTQYMPAGNRLCRYRFTPRETKRGET